MKLRFYLLIALASSTTFTNAAVLKKANKNKKPSPHAAKKRITRKPASQGIVHARQEEERLVKMLIWVPKEQAAFNKLPNRNVADIKKRIVWLTKLQKLQNTERALTKKLALSPNEQKGCDLNRQKGFDTEQRIACLKSIPKRRKIMTKILVQREKNL